MLLNIENLYKYYNGVPILKDISLTIEDRETVGLIGLNGCGKSTLLRIITGMEGFDKTADGKGSIAISDKTTIGFLQQNSGLDGDATISEELHKPFTQLIQTQKTMIELEHEMSTATGEKLAQVSEEYASLSSYFEARDGYRIDVKINTILNGMGFEGVPQSRQISTFSGGEKTRLAMTKLLLEEPNLLILDEPTNHLDFKTLMWLEDYLRGYKGSILIVSHDRYFLNRLCTRICEIELCRLTSYKGDYSAYLVQKKMNSERQLKEFEMQQKEIAKLEDYIVRNKTRASTAKMAKSRQAALDHMERVEKPLLYQKPPQIRLEYDIEPTKDIVVVKSCPVAVGDERKVLVPSLDFNVRRGEHLAIIGPNGIGKTSILKIIQGIIPHDSGSISWGGNVKISYFEQENSTLDARNSVIDQVINRYPRLSEQEARKALASVLINGEDVFKPIGVISGGERAKLCFAIMALNRGNCLVLDEPTNHLDLATKEVLDDVLAQFEGTIILVSHDRYLLNKVATRIVEVTPDCVTSYEGNFDKYMEQKNLTAQELQAVADSQKAEEQRQEYEDKKQKQYRTKEQRANDAKRRSRIKELEKEIEQLEIDIFNLENELTLPEIATDFTIMQEKCNLLEESRNSLNEKMDEWATLED